MVGVGGGEVREGGEGVWSVEKLRMYIRHVKNLKPTMTCDANMYDVCVST